MSQDLSQFHYIRLREGRFGGIDVVGFGTFPKNSVLAGQTMKVFLGKFNTQEEAKAAYPQAEGFTNSWIEPQVSVSHLSDGPDY